jgi:hypothetical protein
MLATHNTVNEGIVMTMKPESPRLTPEQLAELVKQVQALRAVTKMTGVFTSRRIGYLLENLCTADMIEVGKALQLKPREMPTFSR